MDKESFKALIFGMAAFTTITRGKWRAGEESDPAAAIEKHCADMAKLIVLTPEQEGFLILALPSGFKMHPPAVELLRFSASQAAHAADMIEDGGSEPEIMAQLQDTLTSLIDKVAARG